MFAKICGNVCKESFSLVSLSHLKHGLGFTIFVTSGKWQAQKKNGLAAASPNNLLTITHFSNSRNPKK